MIPNPEVGAATFSTLWWTGLAVLFLLSIGHSALMIAYTRAVKRKELFDAKQDERTGSLETLIHQAQLNLLALDKGWQHRLYEIKAEMLECQKNMCTVTGGFVTTQDHHGDMLRLQHHIDSKLEKSMDTLTALHRRLDQYMSERERL